MAKFLGVDIAKLVSQNLGSRLNPLTLTHYTELGREESDPTGAPKRRSSRHAGRGFVEDYTDRQTDGKTILRGDRKVIILAASLTPSIRPVPGDRVDIGSERLAIVESGVTSDPATATYTCQARAY